MRKRGKEEQPKEVRHDGDPYAVNGPLYTGNLVSETRMLSAAADVVNRSNSSSFSVSTLKSYRTRCPQELLGTSYRKFLPAENEVGVLSKGSKFPLGSDAKTSVG